jgi:hypothetical protein
MDKIRDAFDLKFVVQIVTICVFIGIGWGAIKADLTHITDEIQSLKTDRATAWAKQEVINEKVEGSIINCENKHFETMKKLDILIVELQNGKYCKN